MPASVVINHQKEIIQFRGSTDLFLTHPKGRATFDIIKMAHPEIAFELRHSIPKVIKTKQPIRKSGIEFKVNSAVKIFTLEIVPLPIEWDEPLLLILFTEQEPTEIFTWDSNSGKDNSDAKDRKMEKLEQQLAVAHSNALYFSQEQEAYAEGLQRAHEEVVSSNEELQSLNEELETSKEEIQSTNEELITTNQELQTPIQLLNESDEYSSAIIFTIHDPMLVLRKDLRVKSANKGFYNTFGVTREQTEGKLLYELGNKQWDIPKLRELLEKIIPQKSHFNDFEVKHTFLDIGEKIMSLNATRVIQKAHREHLIFLSISDITEVRRLMGEKERREKELLKKEIHDRRAEKLRLEQAVAKGTRELKEANESLNNRNKELLNLNKELEAFAFVASHDLQEPLRKVETFAGLILENEQPHLSDKGKNYFHRVQQQIKRMRQLIEDLLAFCLISADKRKFENTDLNIIIEDVKKEFKEAIAEKNAVIEVHETCDANIIPFQFRQLMHNLISNGLKYSYPKRPPHIKITSRIIEYEKLNIEELPPRKEYCQIIISDNGIGFGQRYNNKIFELFQKLHGKNEYPGTGIGLAIVKKIVDLHNGMITATGELNKGATFTIYLPADKAGIPTSQKK
ncbi:MAG: ATP-binding protein [Fulvivirga sp.]